MTAWGFHYSVGGFKTGSGDFIEKLNSQGIPVCMKGASDAGLCYEAQEKGKKYGVKNVLVWRATSSQNDVPEYWLAPYEAAMNKRNAIKGLWPPELDKSLVWWEVINEPRKEDTDDEVQPTWGGLHTTAWLGLFMVEMAKLMNADGYKVCGPSFSSGEPGNAGGEVAAWMMEGMASWLRYCADNPEMACISHHEYDYGNVPFNNNYPYHYGRFQAIIAAADLLGIPRTFKIIITEFGFQERFVPTWESAKPTIDAYNKLCAAFPQVIGVALWTLQDGWGGISDLYASWIGSAGNPFADWVAANQIAPPSAPTKTAPEFGGTLPIEEPDMPDPDPEPEQPLEGIIIYLTGQETSVKISAVTEDDEVLTSLTLNNLLGIDKLVIEAEGVGDPGEDLIDQPDVPEPGDVIVDLNGHRKVIDFDGLVENDVKGVSLRTSNGLGTDSTDEDGVDVMLWSHLDNAAARHMYYDLFHFINEKDDIEEQIELFLAIVVACIDRAKYLPGRLGLDFEVTSYTTHAEIQYCFQYLYQRVNEVFPDYDIGLKCYSSASWWNPKVPAGITWPANLGIECWQAYYTSASAPAVVPGPSFRPPLMNGFPETDLWQWSSVAGKMFGQTTDPLDANYVMPLEDVPVSEKFKVGDRVEVNTGSLNVRNSPAGTVIGAQGDGAQGTVVAGPVFASNYNRWQIDYDSGADGWSAEDYLVKVDVIVVPTLLGLHASADGGAGAAPALEPAEFGILKPKVVKFLSSNGPELINPIMEQVGSDVVCIVRPFQDWGDRPITPEEFRDWTVNDYMRTVDTLLAHGVPKENIWAELHNEPNLTIEGWTYSWSDGAKFATWGLKVLDYMRPLYPGIKWLYPGLSPGPEIPGLRTPAAGFLAESNALVEACDGLGVHAYWAQNDPRGNALAWIDVCAAMYPSKPVWVTEASYKSVAGGDLLGNEYYQFWTALNQRPSVYGVTFYVASGSNPQYVNEVWIRDGASRGISATIKNLGG